MKDGNASSLDEKKVYVNLYLNHTKSHRISKNGKLILDLPGYRKKKESQEHFPYG
jgi:hypothetical protein